jgi:hypothetical protein
LKNLKLDYDNKINETNKIISQENKNKNLLLKKIDELEDKLNKIMPNDNIINNCTINNTINHQNFTININNYGEEDLSNMTIADWEKIVSNNFDMIPCCIKTIHIDNQQNRSVYVPSMKEGVALVKSNNDWNLTEKNGFVKKLIIDKTILLQGVIDEHGDDFENIDKSKAKAVLQFCSNDENELKRIKNKTILLLVGNKNIIKDTYETINNKKIRY